MLVQLEQLCNRQPLVPIDNDPYHFETLAPANFLMGASRMPNFVFPYAGSENRAHLVLQRWQYLQHLTERLWARWRDHYIPTLAARTKWRKGCTNPEVGELVLVITPDAPRNSWPKARILEINKSSHSDDIVRTVRIRFPDGRTCAKSTRQLIPLLPTQSIPYYTQKSN